MKRFLFIYLPIICIAVAALLKFNSGAIDHEVKNESEPPVQIDSSLTEIPLKTIPTQEEEELKELKEQIQQLNEKVSDLEKENDQLTRISNSEEEEEEEKSKTTTRKTDVNAENQIVNEALNKASEKPTNTARNSDSNSDEIFNFAVVDQKPIFPGCENFPTEKLRFVCFNKKIINHITQYFEYPELARQMGIQGKVYVNFVIEKNGRVSSVTIARGVDKLIDDEAIRIIRKLPRLSPAMNNGKAVRMQYTVPINASLK
jgi:TonB family protein